MASSTGLTYSPASIDLGLGDGLKAQLRETEEERKKRLAAAAAAQKMGGDLGPGTMSLYGAAGGFSI